MLITGANRGLGFEMVKQLLARETGPELVFAGCRQPENAQVGIVVVQSRSIGGSTCIVCESCEVLG